MKKLRIVIAAIIVMIGFMVFIRSMAPQELEIQDVDIAQISNGTYYGTCDNRAVYVQSAVSVIDGKITDIEIIEHRNGMGGKAEGIVQDVLRMQSLAIDVVAGATYSSQTILKSIEEALLR